MTLLVSLFIIIKDHAQNHRQPHSKQQINVNPNSASLNPP